MLHTSGERGSKGGKDSQVEGGEDGEWQRWGGVIMRVVMRCGTTAERKEREHEEHQW